MSPASTLIIRDVIVVDADADGLAAGRADVVIEGEHVIRVEPVGATSNTGDADVIDGDGRLLLPGFVDAHSHADGLLFDPDVQLALLRQGVTTVIGGQDGVSYAPGDGGPDWPEMLTFAHIAAPEYRWAHGLTLEAAARRVSTDPAGLALDVLAASRLEVNVVMAVRNECTPAELATILAHPRAVGGSDGIFVGAHPHPRARGTFARYLRSLVIEQGALGWADAAALVSTRAADRFGLGRRGRIRQGWIADVALVDAGRVADTATYDAPLGLAEGIDDVLVAGVPVLAGGALTGATPGRGIRRSLRPPQPADSEEA